MGLELDSHVVWKSVYGLSSDYPARVSTFCRQFVISADYYQGVKVSCLSSLPHTNGLVQTSEAVRSGLHLLATAVDTFYSRMAGASIMMVTYGHQVTSAEDEFVALAEAVREHGENTPGSNIVDLLPIREPPHFHPYCSCK